MNVNQQNKFNIRNICKPVALLGILYLNIPPHLPNRKEMFSSVTTRRWMEYPAGSIMGNH